MDDSRSIRVVYADDDAGYRTRLLGTLLTAPELDVVAVAVDGPGALEAIEAHRPDVALIDADAPGLSGMAVAERVARHDPPLPTQVLLLAARPRAGRPDIIDRASSESDICAALTAAGR